MTLLSLVPIHDAVAGVEGVAEFYWVLKRPDALAGMPYPHGNSVWSGLAAAGFSNVICLTDEHPRYDPAPLTVDCFPLQDLFGGRQPPHPESEAVIVRQAASRVIELLSAGRGVVVHCAGGRGRSGTVIGAVLVGLGLPPRVVAEWLDELHRARGKDGWPESNWQRLVLDGGDHGPTELPATNA